MKRCKTCERELPLTDYYMAGKYPLAECKECWKERVKLRRLTNPAVQEYDRKRAKEPERVQRFTEYRRKWRQQNPDAYRAHSAVNNAVRDGRLQKKPCEICASTTFVHAHHKDYSRPLDVVWLCARCHHRLHALFPELEGVNKHAS